MKERIDDCIVVGFVLGEMKEEGLLDHLTLMEIYDLGKKYFKEWRSVVPVNFNWEAHYFMDGEDWDMEIRKFVTKALQQDEHLNKN